MSKSTQELLLITAEDSDKELLMYLQNSNFKVNMFYSCDDAFQAVVNNNNKYSTIVIGNHIDDKDTLNFLGKIKTCSETKTTPVIIERNEKHSRNVKDFILSGAWYYLPYPLNRDEVNTVINTAIRDNVRYKRAENSVVSDDAIAMSLVSAEFKFSKITEVHNMANFLAATCPNPKLTVVGISEILINAIEHGNLKISYAEKSKLHAQGKWLEEVDRRASLPEFADKFINIKFLRKDGKIKIRIKDCGDGFDWKKYKNFDQNRLLDNHGRGIVIAISLSFQNIEYFGNGNEVECTINLHTND